MAISEGVPQPILTDGDPRLRIPSRRADPDAADFDQRVDDLAATLADFRRREGFGRAISAPQIGWNERVIICDLGSGPRAILNPEVTWRSPERQTVWDDCLSVPGQLVRVERAKSISMRWLGDDGYAWTWERLPPDMAELFLHEIDHLDGVLMLDHAAGPGDVAPMNQRNELIGDRRPSNPSDPMAQHARRWTPTGH